VELYFLIGGEPSDAAAVAAFTAAGAGRNCVLHPGFSDRAQLQFPGVESRAVGIDLIAMNGLEEERAYREAEAMTAAFHARLAPVPFHGVDLAACAGSLLGVRLDRVLMLVAAIEQLRAEGYGRVVVWLRSFARHFMAILAEAEALGWGPAEKALLRVREGRFEPEPVLWARQPFDPVGARVLTRLQAGQTLSRDEAVGGAAPAPGGLTIMLTSPGAGYLAEAAAMLEAADEAALPYRLLCLDPRVPGVLARLTTATPAGATQVVQRPELGMRAMDPDGLVAALAALFEQFEALADGSTGESSKALGEQTLAFLYGCFVNASAYRHAWLRSLEIERIAAWLDHDRARRLFFYPARTHLDPAPRLLMAARGGWAGSAISRSITADYRNFYVPCADRLAVLGEAQVEIAAARGFPAAGLRPIGSPQADAAFARAAAGASREPSRDRPMLLAATSGFDRAGEARWIPRLAAAARDAGLSLVLKPHPSLGAAPYRPLLGPDDDAVRLELDADIHGLIEDADAVVTDVSHVGKLAVYRGKPLAVANLSGQPFPYNRFDEIGIATLLADEGAVEAFARAVARGGAPTPDPGARAEFVRAEFAADDGRSGQRLVAFLAEPP